MLFARLLAGSIDEVEPMARVQGAAVRKGSRDCGWMSFGEN
jgi:hypothetical protein